MPAEGPFATVVVAPAGFGGCVFGPALPLPCPANDGPVAMNTAVTTVAITKFFLGIMAPLQRRFSGKSDAAPRDHGVALRILQRGTYVTAETEGLGLSLTDLSPR